MGLYRQMQTPSPSSPPMPPALPPQTETRKKESAEQESAEMLSAVAGLAQEGGPGSGAAAGVLAGFGSGSASGFSLARPKPGRVGATTFARDERMVEMPERVRPA